MLQYEKAIATGQPKEYIEGLASKIAEKLNFKSGGNLKDLVNRIGGDVEVQFPDDEVEDGSIHVNGAGDFTIFLSPYTGPLRDRFTIAHELGHYFLHSLAGKHNIKVKREGSNRLEWEANWFAAGFLMPEDDFKKQFEELEGHVGSLAAHFAVSTRTVEIRKESLGL